MVESLQPVSAAPTSLLHCRCPSVESLQPVSAAPTSLLHCRCPLVESLQPVSAAPTSLLHCRCPLVESHAACECCTYFTVMAHSHTRRWVWVRIPVPGDFPMATVVQCRKFTLDQNRDRYPSLIGYCSHFWGRALSLGEVSVYVNEPSHCRCPLVESPAA